MAPTPWSGTSEPTAAALRNLVLGIHPHTPSQGVRRSSFRREQNRSQKTHGAGWVGGGGIKLPDIEGTAGARSRDRAESDGPQGLAQAPLSPVVLQFSRGWARLMPALLCLAFLQALRPEVTRAHHCFLKPETAHGKYAMRNTGGARVERSGQGCTQGCSHFQLPEQGWCRKPRPSRS